MSELPQFCPEHGHPGDTSGDQGWAYCPTATEDDPPGSEVCPHFLVELERRIDDVTTNGNYFEMRDGPAGEFYVQEYVNHQPVGEPREFRGGHGKEKG